MSRLVLDNVLTKLDCKNLSYADIQMYFSHLKFLIEQDRSLANITTTNQFSPLLAAVEHGKKDVFEFLLERGAQPLRPNTNRSALRKILFNGQKDYLDLLAARSGYNLHNDLDSMLGEEKNIQVLEAIIEYHKDKSIPLDGSKYQNQVLLITSLYSMTPEQKLSSVRNLLPQHPYLYKYLTEEQRADKKIALAFLTGLKNSKGPLFLMLSQFIDYFPVEKFSPYFINVVLDQLPEIYTYSTRSDICQRMSIYNKFCFANLDDKFKLFLTGSTLFLGAATALAIAFPPLVVADGALAFGICFVIGCCFLLHASLCALEKFNEQKEMTQMEPRFFFTKPQANSNSIQNKHNVPNFKTP